MDNFKLEPEQFEEAANLLKALAHPVRICIVRGLLETGGCNVTKIQGCLDIPQSTVSQNLAKLKGAGIIKGERQGLEITYKVINDKAKQIVDLLF